MELYSDKKFARVDHYLTDEEYNTVHMNWADNEKVLHFEPPMPPEPETPVTRESSGSVNMDKLQNY